jgi:NAD+ kinase
MKIGIVPNIDKENIVDVVSLIVEKFTEYDFELLLCDSLSGKYGEMGSTIKKQNLVDPKDLYESSDVILSVGGDGTMLTTAYEAIDHDTPLIGVNIGKLGFLAEFDLNGIDELAKNLTENNYEIEERIILKANCISPKKEELHAINDIVIDKGRWPKMIQLTVKVDNDYVTTFSADGIIISTPTGSTGYSLSTGGPIVSPKANVITISPISPHTLTMRPLVLSSDQMIEITVDSQHTGVQANCDGQRVYYYEPPAKIEIVKDERTIKLVHTRSTNYFEILRKKLLWGLDVRSNPYNKSEKDSD